VRGDLDFGQSPGQKLPLGFLPGQRDCSLIRVLRVGHFFRSAGTAPLVPRGHGVWSTKSPRSRIASSRTSPASGPSRIATATARLSSRSAMNRCLAVRSKARQSDSSQSGRRRWPGHELPKWQPGACRRQIDVTEGLASQCRAFGNHWIVPTPAVLLFKQNEGTVLGKHVLPCAIRGAASRPAALWPPVREATREVTGPAEWPRLLDQPVRANRPARPHILREHQIDGGKHRVQPFGQVCQRRNDIRDLCITNLGLAAYDGAGPSLPWKSRTRGRSLRSSVRRPREASTAPAALGSMAG